MTPQQTSDADDADDADEPSVLKRYHARKDEVTDLEDFPTAPSCHPLETLKDARYAYALVGDALRTDRGWSWDLLDTHPTQVDVSHTSLELDTAQQVVKSVQGLFQEAMDDVSVSTRKWSQLRLFARTLRGAHKDAEEADEALNLVDAFGGHYFEEHVEEALVGALRRVYYD